jgi:hypothetical protein
MMLAVRGLTGGGWTFDAAIAILLVVEMGLALLTALLLVRSPRRAVFCARGSSGLGLFTGVGLLLLGLLQSLHAPLASMFLKFGLAFLITSGVILVCALRLGRQRIDLPPRFSSTEWLAIDTIVFRLLSILGSALVLFAFWSCWRDEFLEIRHLVIGLVGAGLVVWSLKRAGHRR